jgi:hypothetical protein
VIAVTGFRGGDTGGMDEISLARLDPRLVDPIAQFHLSLVDCRGDQLDAADVARFHVEPLVFIGLVLRILG